MAEHSLDKLKAEYENASRQGISFVYQKEEGYPEKLKQLEDMPYGIFYKGNLPLQTLPSVAVVGARNASYEGKQLADKFGYELAENGVQVISGMARGLTLQPREGQ